MVFVVSNLKDLGAQTNSSLSSPYLVSSDWSPLASDILSDMG